MAPPDVDGGASARRWIAETLRDDVSTLPTRAGDDEPETGQHIGRYLLLERIGMGGMGIVFAAFDPDLDRRVALKILRGGTVDKSADLRLLREARALARLAHPNVVPVFDVGIAAGRTADATSRASGESSPASTRMFVAMEYVEGVTLTRWLAQEPRAAAETLAVFVDAGRGLEAAHAIGIVHRDFKPDNVLIGDDARVRVGDFGLARPTLASAGTSGDEIASASELDEPLDPTRLTRVGVVLGTPAYMAPEQHRGEDVTAATDQFAFCVALYEALHGVRPFTGATARELGSQKLAGRIATPTQRAVPAWLHAAIVRGLAADPADRWPQIGDLLALLERGPRRRTRMWLALAGAGVVAGAMLWPGAGQPCEDDARVTAVWSAPQRKTAHDAFLATGLGYAEASWTRTEAIIDHYADEWSRMRRDNCLAATGDGAITSEQLDLRTQCLDDRLAALEDLVGVMVDADAALIPLAVTTASGLPPLLACLEPQARTRELDPGRAAEIQAIGRGLTRASVLENAGRYHAARGEAELLLARADRLGDPGLRAAAQQTLGSALEQVGEYEAARRHLLEAMWLGTEGGDDIVVANAALDLVWLEGVDLPNADAALEWARHAEAAIQRNAEPSGRAQLAIAVGAVESSVGRRAEALVEFEKARDLFAELGDARRVDLATSLQNLGITLGADGRHAEGRDHLLKALAIYEEVQGPDHPDTANALDALAGELLHLGDLEEARARFERAVSIRAAALPASHPNLARSHNNFANLLEVLGEYDAAEEHFARAIDVFTAAYGDSHPFLGATLANRANVRYRQGKNDEARTELERALRILQAELPPDHPFVLQTTAWLARSDVAAGDFDSARRRAEPLVAGCEQGREDPLSCGHARFALARAEAAAGRHEAARRLAERARTDLHAAGVMGRRDAAEAEHWLAVEHR